VESKWTHDADYLRLLGPEAARPLSPVAVKKRYEKFEKDADEEKNSIYFTIRGKDGEPGRLIGFIRIQWIEWTHGSGWIRIGIGDSNDRMKGNGSEALRLLLRYAFGELNLYRLTAVVPEYNPAALRLFEKAGFRREVCRRQALYRDGRRWDLHALGLLRQEWDDEKDHSE
jgi:RimJ/RimL family protein N-acetyltransferase